MYIIHFTHNSFSSLIIELHILLIHFYQPSQSKRKLHYKSRDFFEKFTDLQSLLNLSVCEHD